MAPPRKNRRRRRPPIPATIVLGDVGGVNPIYEAPLADIGGGTDLPESAALGRRATERLQVFSGTISVRRHAARGSVTVTTRATLPGDIASCMLLSPLVSTCPASGGGDASLR